ncbi:hypothetical protein MCOR27_009727 [Pyricularia oryzae]|uniref:Coiled-coil domain-containing protein 130 n=2 Tax=Pyricularia TaxID=48558 RepID=A0ABQ8NL51_PYRGI|nr:hypothetical protein MCOR01_007513 [Pyricularia oryzae]KAI6298712.1 hypothetical protein MCOR33_005240 [Pyricularia grisea]KAI6258361.1 hypothetical protein MCOR19_005239 [Pyricularia oryzae]KAI6269474.1 hypothetical protein MCOR27_009727 [Pyricularia oryzae]KAI6284908.1 hypothetical protein MCOR26_001802 [Pyricularia oryzae]
MQGFNMGRYVPPDVEGTITGNKLHGKHPQGSRARHGGGALTVRFEMPFPVWCEGCPQETLIGQGVRFNAIKRRVGNYHSTPIFSFAIKHPACGGDIEIRTDPQNTDYVVVSGGRRREPGLRSQEGESLVSAADLARASLASIDEARGEVKDEKAREAAFAKLEKTIADRAALARSTSRVEELVDVSARAWDDPYSRNSELRNAFRAGRKEREAMAVSDEALKDKMSLGDQVVLGPETDYDRRLAALMDYGSTDGARDGARDAAELAMSKPLFGESGRSASPAQYSKPKEKGKIADTGETPRREKPRMLKAEISKEKTREGLIGAIAMNQRTATDPFLEGLWSEKSKRQRIIPGLKRKRDPLADSSSDEATRTSAHPPKPPQQVLARTASPALVSYDSDQEE